MSELPPEIWRTRLLQLTLLRLAGVVLAFVGIIWAATDKLGPPSQIGGTLLAIGGMGGALLLARRLRAKWLQPPA